MIHFDVQKKLHTADGDMQLQVNLQIESGQFICLYGSSGAGKTSVLRMLAGLLKPDNGFIQMNGVTWFDKLKHIDITPQQRSIGFVFQDYALFPNMNVRDNIAFALSKKKSIAIVDELLELTGLSLLASRKIQTLSGGQKQRVALARAIAKEPLVLLLDEPLSAIDHTMRNQLQTVLLEVHKRFALTTILVSHDMDEIIKLSDKVILLENGMVKQGLAPGNFFLPINQSPLLTGNIVSIEEHGSGTISIVLLNNRMLKVDTMQRDADYKPGDTVEITYEQGIPLIRKL